jgi:hypothetical protein
MWKQLHALLQQLNASHAGHSLIRNDHRNVLIGLDQLQCLRAGSCGQNWISIDKGALKLLKIRYFVIYNKNSFFGHGEDMTLSLPG